MISSKFCGIFIAAVELHYELPFFRERADRYCDGGFDHERVPRKCSSCSGISIFVYEPAQRRSPTWVQHYAAGFIVMPLFSEDYALGTNLVSKPICTVLGLIFLFSVNFWQFQVDGRLISNWPMVLLFFSFYLVLIRRFSFRAINRTQKVNLNINST